MILPPHTAKPDPWQASWIGLNASTTANRLPLSLFRKEVVLDDAAAQVTAWISADVHYRLYINGRLVSRRVRRISGMTTHGNALTPTRFQRSSGFMTAAT